MKPSELFEGENSSLKRTYNNAVAQEIQEWELNMQNHLISACDWIEDVKIKQMTVAKILSRWAVVRDEFSQKLKEQRKEIQLTILNSKHYTMTEDGNRMGDEVLNILSKYE